MVRRIAVLLHRVAGQPVYGDSHVAPVTGASKAEILADLKFCYPDHEEKSLKTHTDSEVSSLQVRLGKKIIRTDDATRGRVYRFE